MVHQICNWKKYHNRHSSKSIRVTKLSFCQNDPPSYNHFGKRTAWSLICFLNYPYFDIQPSLLTFETPSKHKQCNMALLNWKLSEISKGIRQGCVDLRQFGCFLKDTNFTRLAIAMILVDIEWDLNNNPVSTHYQIKFVALCPEFWLLRTKFVTYSENRTFK